MNKSFSAGLAAAAAVLALGGSGGAQAQSTFVLNGVNCTLVSGDSTCTNSGITASMSAYGSASFAPSVSASNFVKYSLSGGGAAGFGANTPGESSSPFDSPAPGSSVEVMLLNFSQLAYVSAFTLVTDNAAAANSDNYVLYRWDGAGAPSLTTTSVRQNSSAITGWTLVKAGDASADAVATSTPIAGTTGWGVDSSAANALGSNWWMVGTYLGASFTAGDDVFRIERLSAQLCTGSCVASAVPEPSSLVLMALGVAFAGAVHRRRGRARQALIDGLNSERSADTAPAAAYATPLDDVRCQSSLRAM